MSQMCDSHTLKVKSVNLHYLLTYLLTYLLITDKQPMPQV